MAPRPTFLCIGRPVRFTSSRSKARSRPNRRFIDVLLAWRQPRGVDRSGIVSAADWIDIRHGMSIPDAAMDCVIVGGLGAGLASCLSEPYVTDVPDRGKVQVR
jgi:hypothetical protein